MPAYEKEMNDYKGPQFYTAEGKFITPDLLVFNAEKIFWAEVKNKSAFSWHRNTQTWTTGIDLHHYEHYKRVRDISKWPVWLLFLQAGGKAKDSPADSPSGLYGGELEYLSAKENHRSPNWGRHGMVYWAEETLKRIADYEDVINC